MLIYEYKDWPNITWKDEALSMPLAEVRFMQGCLLGRMSELGFDLKNEASLSSITNDIVHSSAIEGEH